MQRLRVFGLSFLLLMFVWYCPISAQQCTVPGYSCSIDCKQLILCINENLLTMNCPEGFVCDATAQTCVAGTSCPGSTCTTNTFECTTAGIFPDPYSCSNFIECPSTGGTPTNKSCPADTVFEPCTSSCSKTFDCTPPRIQCNSVLDMGIVPGNPEMFYDCNVGTSCIPKILKCNDGAIFDTDNNRCIPVGLDVCKGQSYVCLNEGFYPDPNNCTVYYYCNQNLILTTHVCDPNYHYVQDVQGCLSGACQSTVLPVPVEISNTNSFV